MPRLIQCASPLKILYAVSLPHSLLSTAALICAAPFFEGLGDWLLEARNRMPADLLQDLCLLVTFPGRYQRFTTELIARLPEHSWELDFDGLMAALRSLPGSTYQDVALKALLRSEQSKLTSDVLLAMVDRPEEWAEYLQGAESEVAPAVVSLLVKDGDLLKERVLVTLEQFWLHVYCDEFEVTQPRMERSVRYHRSQPNRLQFGDLFLAVTGRLLPEHIVELLPSLTEVVFVPSCYVGPYVAYSHFDDHLILYYNCRSAPVASRLAQDLSLYPPLKALADETRLQILYLLQGCEMYAQEIVERLDISQPAVSRHLNLMAAAGVLRIRRQANAKYYSINGEILVRLADALRGFL